MDYQSIATFIMEMAGTVAFAASGAMVGVERNMDIFGISVLGVATAVGGGMIRDIVLGVIPPAVFRNPVYALVSVLTSCVVFFVFYFKREFLEGHRREAYDKFMLVMDSVGLGIFTVVESIQESPGIYGQCIFACISGNDHRSRRWSPERYDGQCAAVYICKAYLCLCIHHRGGCVRIYESVCWKCGSYDRIFNRGSADPLSGSTLPLESAEAVTT